MIKNISLQINPNSYNNKKVTSIDIYKNNSKSKSFQTTWHRIGRKLISKNTNLHCAVSFNKMELYNNYPLVHGILLFTETKPTNIYYVSVLVKKTIYYIIPISYQVLESFFPNFEKYLIPGRLYNTKVFLNKISFKNDISNFIQLYNKKYCSVIKIINFIQNWLNTKKSILEHEILECEKNMNTETSRCSIS